MRCRIAQILAGIAVAALAIGSAGAAPVEPALQQQLLDLFDRFNATAGAGKLDEALKTRSAKARKMLQREIGKGKEREENLALLRQMTPDGFEVRHTHLAKTGKRASILGVASKQIPLDAKVPADGPKPGSTVRSELTLVFVKEGGAWKYDTEIFGMDPDEITACASDSFDGADAFDHDRDVSFGGPIRRVAFEADHTLIVIRVVDEENCAFLPDRATLEKAGLKTEKIVPYAILSAEGAPHKTDKQKLWIDRMKIEDEPDED